MTTGIIVDVGSPASIFLRLWCEASRLNPTQRHNALPPEDGFKLETIRALEFPSATDAFNELNRLASIGGFRAEVHGRMLSLMRSIDEVFYRIHPRAQTVPSSLAPSPAIPNWLRDLRDQRYVFGHYVDDGTYRLIPRGPLRRTCREEIATNADSLPDRFAALAVVPSQLFEDQRPIRVLHKTLGVDVARGIGPATTSGPESIVFIPVAESRDDLEFNVRSGNGKAFVDVRLNPSINAVNRIVEALGKIGGVDIAIAPEFVICSKDADKLQAALISQSGTSPRLLVAGTGLTSDTDEGLPWNEARCLNRFGRELWRQRKIWPAGIVDARAASYGIDRAGAAIVIEDTASGGEIAVVDADNLGRCVILICQDIEARPLSEDLIRLFQPDWVFVPILDPGIRIGGWVHQRTLALSSISKARFLVACSTTLGRKAPDSRQPGCGLAVGPKSGDNIDKDRAVRLVEADDKHSPEYAILEWRTDAWNQTWVSDCAPLPVTP